MFYIGFVLCQKRKHAGVKSFRYISDHEKNYQIFGNLDLMKYSNSKSHSSLFDASDHSCASTHATG